MINFYVSEEESIINGLNIARATLSEVANLNQLYALIFENEIDVCKLKLSLSDVEVFNKLSNCPIPFAVYSILIKQVVDVSAYHYTPNNKIKFEEYSRLDEKSMYRIVERILENDTAQYYTSKLNDAFFKRKNTIETIANFQTRFDHQLNENKYAFIAYFDDKPIGFCSMVIEGDIAKGDYVGILPEFRNNDFFKYFFHKEILEAKLKKCKTFEIDTVLLNPKSLNKTLSEGAKIDGGVLNINLFSLLKCSKGKERFFKSSIKDLLQNTLMQLKQDESYIGERTFLSKFHFYRTAEDLSNNLEWLLKKCYHVENELCYIVLNKKSGSFSYLTFKTNNLT